MEVIVSIKVDQILDTTLFTHLLLSQERIWRSELKKGMHPIKGVLIIIMVILLPFVQLNLQTFVFFLMMCEQWEDKCVTVLTTTMIRQRNPGR